MDKPLTYDELKTKLDDLPHSRYRAKLVDEIYEAAVAAEFQSLSSYIERMVRDHFLSQPSLPPSTNAGPTEPIKTLGDEAIRMAESDWAQQGFPGAKDVEGMARFLSEYGNIRHRTYDDLTDGEKRRWQVAVSLYTHHERKREARG